MSTNTDLDDTSGPINVGALQGTAGDDTFNFTIPIPAIPNSNSLHVIGSVAGGTGTDTLSILKVNDTAYTVNFSEFNTSSIEVLDLRQFSNSTVELNQFIFTQGGTVTDSPLLVKGNNSPAQAISVFFTGLASAENWTFSNWNSTTSFRGSTTDDTITGSIQNDDIATGSGDDTVFGSSGIDVIRGGPGNDIFNMQLLNENDKSTITGGLGSDTYVVRQISPGTVIVTDFNVNVGGDVINVDDILSCSVSFDAASNPFDPVDGHLKLLQQGADTVLQWDLDGFSNNTNSYKPVLLLQGISLASLTSANFITNTYTAINPVSDPAPVSNHAPVPGPLPTAQIAMEDSQFSYVLPANAFIDPDAGDTLTYSATGMPSWPAWLSFDAITRTFSGEFHGDTDVGASDILVTATDSHGLQASTRFLLTAVAVNDAPAGSPSATLAGGTEDTVLSIPLANLLVGFTDEENDPLSVVNLSADHGGLAFVPNAVNGDAWLFTPEANYNGLVTLKYNVSDTHNPMTSTQQHFNLAAVNDAPVVATPGTPPTIVRGAPIAMTPVTFTDVDSVSNGDILHYTATLADGSPLPATLQFNSANGSFSGIAGAADVGNYVVKVTATDRLEGDPAGLHASGTFSLAIISAPGDIVGTGNGDILNGNAGNNVIFGLGGNDLLNGGAGDDQLIGGAGNDLLNGGVGSDIMTGQLGDDVYTVDNAGDQVIEKAGGGLDLVLASVTTALSANVENLVLTGTANLNGTGNGLDNFLTGNFGDNVLTGNDGNDTLYGGAGRDTLLGGAGNDSYILAREDNFVDTVTEAAGMGTDTVFLFSGSYTLVANVENLALQGIATNGTGNELNNVITGNGLNNVLIGGAGNDQLSGLDGNDTLTGGVGQDQFIFAAAPSRGNIDLIQDFTRGQDQLVLDALAFGGTGLHDRLLDATMFRSGARLSTAGDSNDHVIYDTSAGKLYYDADGAGGAAAMQIATLANAPALDAGSIFILH